MPQYTLKGIGPPYPKQQEIIDYLFEPSDKVKQVDICCGRGFGKSVVAIDIAQRMLSMSPNHVGLFLEPDWNRVVKVFLKKWQQIIPKELYTLNKSERCITWFNGAMLFYAPRNITGNKGSADDSQVGQDTNFVIDDEAALRCSIPMYMNNLATIRNPGLRFYLTVSTPRHGPYKQLVTDPKHVLFRGSSRDNPYLPADYVDNLFSNMSPNQARRELEGEFVALEGQCWKEWTDGPWPEGNVHPHTYDQGKPWYLFLDLGVGNGAYLVVQRVEPKVYGQKIFDGAVWVVCAELMPEHDGSARAAFKRLLNYTGKPPCMIACGADMSTRSNTDGLTSEYFANKIFGHIPIKEARGYRADKQIQADCLEYMIRSADNKRQFCVSEEMRTLEGEHRGVVAVMQEDTWPDEREKRRTFFFNKDGILEHCRDALLYGAVEIMHEPMY